MQQEIKASRWGAALLVAMIEVAAFRAPRYLQPIMIGRLRIFLALTALVVILPAAAQDLGPFDFRLVSPTQLLAGTGMFRVTWQDVDPDDIDPGKHCITWYYTPSADGPRRRMVTLFHDDFSRGFRQNWQPQGNLLLDWDLRRSPRDAARGDLLYGGEGAGPCISQFIPEASSVVSVLLKPDGLGSNWRIGIRMQRNGRGIILHPGRLNRMIVEAAGERRPEKIADYRPGNWYWVELGARTLRSEVQVRCRVFNEDRSRLLCDLDEFIPAHPKGEARGLRERGAIMLQGPAYFAEVFVDPWQARWLDDQQNSFEWNTEGVAPGAYHLVADVMDPRSRTHTRVSDFKVEVSNPRRSVD